MKAGGLANRSNTVHRMANMENDLHPAGRLLADRLNSLLAIRGHHDPATGRIQAALFTPALPADTRQVRPTGFSLRHIERCIKGYAKPNIETIWLLAETLGVRPSYFLGGEL